MTMDRYICIHGHFYQPPRENPWLNEIEIQEGAYPYHDWNERINAECYARNAASRLLDANKDIIDIVNNYSKMSFNFGPTLLSWLEIKEPEVYQAILEADKISQQRFSGHGGALAQVYNHIIMPLANSRDKRTQILWGIKDFEHRFKRRPEGMWLAETAVDLESLEVMAEYGINFTILAPRQAKRVRKMEDNVRWRHIVGEKIDPKLPYLCRLPSGRTICIFIYDGPISLAVAFGGLLNNGEDFANRLMGGFDQTNHGPQLLHIATDGESYGHHHRFGDMALAYCFHHLETHQLAHITVYAEFLEKFPPSWEIEIMENTSWSCTHGVERWRSNCGCHSGRHKGWQQQWREPLRRALDWLRDGLTPVYEMEMGPFLGDVWQIRDHYIDVVLDHSKDNVERFFSQHILRPFSDEEKTKILKLLEMQFNAMLMYTSCGWFFDEISGIETVQIIKYAARAIQLATEIHPVDLETDFVKILEEAQSNVPDYVHGGGVYNNHVKPSVVDLLRVGAHYAVSSLFEKYPKELKMYCYTIHSEQYQRKEVGRRTLVVGRGWVRSEITWEKSPFSFVVFHLGDHNIAAGVNRAMEEGTFNNLVIEFDKCFLKTDIPDVIRLIDKYFKNQNYSLWHMFRDEQQKILNQILQAAMGEIEASFRQIYDHHYPLMRIGRENPVTLPRALATVIEFILNRDLIDLLQGEDINMQQLTTLVDDIKRWSLERDRSKLSYVTTNKINELMKRLSRDIDHVELMATIEGLIRTMSNLGLEFDLWKAQNICFSIYRQIYPQKEKLAQQNDTKANRWVTQFNRLGNILKLSPSVLLKVDAEQSRSIKIA